jgi:hypothetical protein
MQPPFFITHNPTIDWVILIVAGIICLYWLRALRLAREGAHHLLRNFVVAILAFFACQLVLTGMRMQSNNSLVLSGVVALIVFARRSSIPRSRYIPKSVKRAVIARDLKNEDYDSAKHHIDHVWPFARGGSHTTDNLRVIEKRKNLTKGAKRPKMREMW